MTRSSTRPAPPGPDRPPGGQPTLDPDAPAKPCPGPWHQGALVPRGEFGANKRTRDRLNSWCKACCCRRAEGQRRAAGVPARQLRPRPAPGAAERPCNGRLHRGQLVPREAFGVNGRSPDGLDWTCLECRRVPEDQRRPGGAPLVFRPAITAAEMAAYGPAVGFGTAAAALGVSRSWLWKARRRGDCPLEVREVDGRDMVLTVSVIALIAEHAPPQDRHGQVLAAVTQAGPDGITAAELAARLDPDGTWVRVYLHRMVKGGELARAGRGRYVLPAAP